MCVYFISIVCDYIIVGNYKWQLWQLYLFINIILQYTSMEICITISTLTMFLVRGLYLIYWSVTN